MKLHKTTAFKGIVFGILVLLAFVAGAATAAGKPVSATGGVLPNGAHSDQVAWEQFVGLVAPAGKTRVAFETWAGDNDTYSTAPAWPALSALERKPLRHGPLARLREPHGSRATGGACVQPCFAEETRRNRAAFRYIVQNKLHSRAGLASAYVKAQSGWRVGMPEDAVELKADWVAIDTLIAWLGRHGVKLNAAQVRAQYYTAVSEGNSYALVALQMSAKDTPAWIWASFEHRLTPGRCDGGGCSDRFGARQRVTEPRAGSPNQQYPACDKTPALKTLFKARGLAPVWNNYCMRSTQTAFVTTAGEPIVSPGRQSSCIACHASAGFTREGAPYTKLLASNPLGTVKLPADIVANDFRWGILAINEAGL